jgi:hypothetical protein
LKILSVSGIFAALLLQITAFLWLSGIPKVVYQIFLLFAAAMACFFLAKTHSAPSIDASQSSMRLPRLLYRIVGLEWLVWSVAFVLLIAPESEVPVYGMNFSRPFAVWTVAAPVYNSLYLGWLQSMAALFFATILVNGARVDQRKVDRAASTAATTTPRLLRWKVIAYLLLPPIVTFIVGLGLLESSLTHEATAQLLITAAVIWGLIALLVISIALIVSGLR